MTIGELIKSRRESLNKTLEDVGQAIGVSRATVSRWETGNIKSLKRSNAVALAKVLGLDPAELAMPTDVLTNEEKEIINAYRLAKPGTQEAVKKLLDVHED